MAASETTTTGRPEFESPSMSEIDLSQLRGIGDAPRTNGSELSIDETFELLKNARRRAVVRYLLQQEGKANLSELAEHIAAAENGISVHELSSDQRKRVYIGLYQCHLPKMDNLGVIEYDKNRGSIVLQESVSQLLPYMELPEDRTDETPTLVLGAAGGIAALVMVGAVGLGPLGLVPAVGWTAISVIALLAVSLIAADIYELPSRAKNE